MINAIWAEDRNGLIGFNDELPWDLPRELQHFKKVTDNSIIVMGRKTYDGMEKRSLPNRTTVVLTRDKNYKIKNGLVFNTLEECLDWYKSQDRDMFVIGGAEIIKAFEPYIELIYRTVIQQVFLGDTYFPKDFNLDNFEKLSETRRYLQDKNNEHEFIVYKYLMCELNHTKRKLVSICDFWTARKDWQLQSMGQFG